MGEEGAGGDFPRGVSGLRGGFGSSPTMGFSGAALLPLPAASLLPAGVAEPPPPPEV